ncbi:MAG: hypothetical protein ACRYF3_09225 [Janthinobacterium lividum]
MAAPAAVAVTASVLGVAVLTSGSGSGATAQAAVPDQLLRAANTERQVVTSQHWFAQLGVRATADARVDRERQTAAAEVERLADEARAAAAAEATRDLQRDPRAVAKLMIAERGWGTEQFSCLDSLWTKESGWDYSADNPTSSAYGIPQALPGVKMASVGADWRTNPVTQITWGLNYIENRYGTPCSAWSHSRSSNWY